MATVTWIDGNGNWTSGADWSTGSPPGPGDDATIANGGTVSITSGITVNSIAVTSGLLDVEDAAGTVDVAGDVTLTSGGFAVDAGAGAGGSTVAVGGTLQLGLVTIGNTALSAPTTITVSALTTSAGLLDELRLTGNTTSGTSNEATLNVLAAAPATLNGVRYVTGNALLGYSSGAIATIGVGSIIGLDGPQARIAVAGDTSGNSALSALTVNKSQLHLAEGAVVTTNSGLDFTNSELVSIESGATLSIGGTLFNNAYASGVRLDNFSGSGAATTLIANGLSSTRDIQIEGNLTNSKYGSIIDIKAAAPTTWTGRGAFVANALLEFASGGIETIVSGATLAFYSSQARIALASDTTSNSALTGLVSNAGTIRMDDGVVLGLDPVGTLTNTGRIYIDSQGVAYTAYKSVVGFGTVVNTGSLVVGESTQGTPASYIKMASLYNTGFVPIFGDTLHAVKAGPTVSITGAVTNSGLIETSLATVDFGSSVTNKTGGRILSNETGVYLSQASATVTNAGSINGLTGAGIDLKAGGVVVNQIGGTITARSYGIEITGASGAVYNAGYIGRTYNHLHFYYNAAGIALMAGGTVANYGRIVGAQTAGILVDGAIGTVANAGTISGPGIGIELRAGGTVTDGGTIIGGGGTGVSFGGSGANLLLLEHGSAISGKVVGSTAATDTVELAGSLGSPVAADYNALGLTNFEEILFGAGGYNTLMVANTAGSVGETISNFTSPSDIIDLAAIGTDGTISSFSTVTDTITVTGSLGSVTLRFDSIDSLSFMTTGDGGSGTDVSIACFCRGTRILTPEGEVAVEELAIGDAVVTLSGGAKPLKWIGRRSYIGWLAAGNPKAMPICCKPGALADGVPKRELWLSPEHAVYVDGALVPAELLVNGTSIVKAQAIEEVHYFHLEFDGHEIVTADGAPAESFVDDGSRGIFQNAAEYRRLYPQDVPAADVRFCAPRLEDGLALEALRRRLAWRGRRLQPDGTAIPGVLDGNLDGANRSHIWGWARDPKAPQTRVSLVIFANAAEIGRVVADRYRGDLAGAGSGDGRYAFDLAIPGGLVADSRHEIIVCRADDGAALPGSPTVLEIDESRSSVPLGALRGQLDVVDDTRICGWAQDGANGERRVDLLVLADREPIGRVLANRYRRDLEQAGLGSGCHGFELVFPSGLPAPAARQIRVVRDADGAELPGSPFQLRGHRLDPTAERNLVELVDDLAAADEERALTLLTAATEQLLARRATRCGRRGEREALRLFRRRWGIEPDGQDRGDSMRALIIDTHVPRATRDAGSVAVLSHIRALRALGYAVSVVAAEEMHDGAAAAQLAQDEAVTPCAAPFYSGVEDVLRRQAGALDLVYLHRAAMADRYLALARRYCPKARIIFSVGDLHHVRLARQAQVEARADLMAQSRRFAVIEHVAALSADIVLTHSPVEAAILRGAVAPGKVHVVPFAVEARRPCRPFAERHGIAFVGGIDHAPNGDAVHYLVQEILPLVWDADPDITCKIVGHGWNARRLPGRDRRVEIVGPVADLDRVFNTVRLTVAPLRFGAGIKGKVLDSLAAGLPCMMTPVAAEGLSLPEPLSQLVGDGAEALAELIRRQHNDPDANMRAAAAARRLAAHFSLDHVTAALSQALSTRPPAQHARTREPPAANHLL